MNIYDEAIESIEGLPHTMKVPLRRVLKRAKKVEELLGLYQYLNENTNDYDLNPDEVDEIHNKIYELEEEMK